MTNLNIWKVEQTNYDISYKNTDEYFNQLYETPQNNLTYREGQHNLALDIMEAIKNKSILLIQAGVGIGKSYGYLIPIFYTYQSVENFNKIVISTSSRELQQQLLADIHKISNMLNITINVDIAKGINNYACVNRINYLIRSINTSEETKKILQNIIREIEIKNSSDRTDLMEISEEVWHSIQLKSRGYCSKCGYSKFCPFYQKNQKLKLANIIITNHANLISSIADDQSIIHNMDMLVIDEAHQLENNITNVKQKELQLTSILNTLDSIKTILSINHQNKEIVSNENTQEKFGYIENLKTKISSLFSNIRRSASISFSINNKNNHSITESNRLVFQCNHTIYNQLIQIIREIQKIILDLKEYEIKNGYTINTEETGRLKNLLIIFQDITLKNNSQNIYWVSFYKKNLINLGYAPKSNLTTTNALFSKKVPVVCTSATMLDPNNTYSTFSQNLELDKLMDRTITYAEEQKSPFDYSNNTLFYYDETIPSPNNYEDYIITLATKIIELIRATNGKALILFTSKKCMKDVYELVKMEEYPFDILLQTDTNTNEVKKQFHTNTNSCLFATGTFWEGIDIKGPSLSNLIITHLPFDVVDAITYTKASQYKTKEEQFKQVYLPRMMIKLKQAMGRLIRDYQDTGIISCLDSRVVKYLNLIKQNTEISNFTNNEQEAMSFIDQKILSKEEKTSGYTLKR